MKERENKNHSLSPVEQVKAYHEALKGELMQGQTKEYLEYIKFMSRFHRYSPMNQVLIKMQRPDATLVRGYRQWADMGFQVKGGEKGIMIMAPIIAKIKDPDLETGEVNFIQKVVGYRDAYVFDRTQLVDDTKIPDYWAKLPDTAQEQEHLVWETVERCGIRIGFTDIGRSLWLLPNCKPNP